jgi:hypothetical protein
MSSVGGSGMLARFLALVLALALGGFVFAPSAATADAPVPTHAVGDAVGYGTGLDLEEATRSLFAILRFLDDQDKNFTINELSLTGNLDIWAVAEVVEATPDFYRIQEDRAAGFRADLVVNLTSVHFPLEGTHPGTVDPNLGCIRAVVEHGNNTAAIDFDILYLATSSGVSEWTVSEFALRGSETANRLDYNATYVLRNVPVTTFDPVACVTTVAYEDYDLTLAVDIDSEIREDYDPALDYFDFPIADAEVWSASSNETVAGTIGGSIDLDGLSPEEERELFAALNETLALTGLTVTGLGQFPIVIEELSVLVGADPILQDGVIDDIPIPVSQTLQARADRKTLADGQFHDVYLISQPAAGGLVAPPCSAIYSPEFGFVMGYECAIEGTSVFELENVAPATARERIEQTKATYGPSGGAESRPLAGFGAAAIYLAFVLIAVAAIAVVVLVLRRPRKPAMAPAPEPPGAFPPGPP